MKEFKMSENNYILCPGCNGEGMHQGRVEVFNREEDCSNGLHVEVEGQRLKSNRDLIGNPSPRRSGVVITMTCEDCLRSFDLNIYQHKGRTFQEWQ